MDEAALTALLQGQFICAHSHPNVYEWLQQEPNRLRIEEALGMLGRTLATTASERAFFAAYKTVTPDNRSKVREHLVRIRQEIKVLVEFVVMCMDAIGQDRHLLPGDVMQFGALLSVIEQQPQLQERLRSFVHLGREFASSDASPRSMLERLLQQLVKHGYLIERRHSDSYCVTGKIDYFYDVMDYILEHEPALKDAVEEVEQSLQQQALEI